MTENYREIAKRREEECNNYSGTLKEQLRFFSKTNWITALLPLLLATCAASAFFASEDWMKIIGGITLFGALLAAVHKGLDCDAHQSQCRQLLQAYRGLAVRYRTLCEVEKDDGAVDFLMLEESLASLREKDSITKS